MVLPLGAGVEAAAVVAGNGAAATGSVRVTACGVTSALELVLLLAVAGASSGVVTERQAARPNQVLMTSHRSARAVTLPARTLGSDPKSVSASTTAFCPLWVNRHPENGPPSVELPAP